MRDTFIAIASFVGIWLAAFAVLWVGALLWLHYHHQDVYTYFVPGHSIETKQLEEFYADRRIAMLAAVLAAIPIAQTVFAIATRKK